MNKNILKSNSSLVVIGKSPAWLPNNYESGRIFCLTQGVGFDFSTNKLKSKQLGYQHYSSNVDYTTPQTNLSIDYLLTPYLNNELLMGFVGSGQSGIPSLSGFKNKNYNMYFLSNKKDTADGFDEIGKEPSAQNWIGGEVVCFGNCYLEGYSLSVRLGQIPTVSTKFKASNISAEVLSTGESYTVTGIQIPALDPYSGKLQYGDSYDYRTIPINSGYITGDKESRNDKNPPIALSHKSTFSITGSSASGSYVSPLKNFKNAALQSCDISFDFSRVELYNFGNDSVCDRKLQFPISVNIQTESIVSGFNSTALNTLSGSSATTSNKEDLYDLDFSFSNQIDSVTGFFNFKGAKLTNFSYSTQINNIYKVSASFSVEATENGGFYMGIIQQ